MLKRIVIYTIQVVDFDVKTIFYVDSLKGTPSLLSLHTEGKSLKCKLANIKLLFTFAGSRVYTIT